MMNKVYFPGLNGLRFIAAFLVLVHHNERIKLRLGLENFWDSQFITVVGKLGVILFFVLSGFLITYLLLKEEKKTGSIQVKQFYIRRILRIWPLYFLLMGLGFFVLPNIEYLQSVNDFSILYSNFGSNLFLFLFLMPNVAYIFNSAIPFISQAWSVGVEEQFYLQWPLLMKSVKRKEKLMFGVIALYITLKFTMFLIWKMNPSEHAGLKVFLSFWEIFNIDCMAIGGLAALYYFRNVQKILNFLYKKTVQWITVITLVIFIMLGVRIPYFHYEFYAILFAILILNIATNPKRIFTLESKGLNYLGKVSYGVYMFHPLMLFITAKFLLSYGITNSFIELFCGTMMTVLAASISYELMEKYFLQKKIKYSTLITGDNVEEERG